ncbi:hypothetical protein C8Q72DRAFT_287604 [Fomitopsis betulina]|nr:hypothetical protein C8Q72DRAFT_287604 [Fomitopsis betulina]
MRDSGNRDMEYFWLERIPCRMVELVGVLVGIQVYEQLIVYILDDGSAVIDCNHTEYRLHPPLPASPARPTPRPDALDTPPAWALPRPSQISVPPCASPGGLLRRRKGDTSSSMRSVRVPRQTTSPITGCVLELHRTRYSAADLGPFLVPFTQEACAALVGPPQS